MRWQFGGNLQPVRMICEFDWRECPSAIINYVWSEIVTDVVECLTNEWIMWRVIAMLFVCSLLIHTIYSKTRLMDETARNRENLNVVGCKVQDLELKVNILTYKMQYGTWPLPRQIRGTGVEGELRNVRLTLRNSNDRNVWLKHMLLSPSENASCVPYAKIGPRSVRCLTKLINLETKYVSSKFTRDASPASNRDKSSGSTSEKSINRCKRSSLDIDSGRKIPKSENLGTRRESTLETTINRTNNCRSETQVVKYREYPKNWVKTFQETSVRKIGSMKSGQSDKTPEERVNATHETLHRVKEKLENLHSVLRIYGGPMVTRGKRAGSSSNQELAGTILEDLKNLGNLPEATETDGKTSTSVGNFFEDSSSDVCPRNEEVTGDGANDSTSEFEQCRSDQGLSSPLVRDNSFKNNNCNKNSNNNNNNNNNNNDDDDDKHDGRSEFNGFKTNISSSEIAARKVEKHQCEIRQDKKVPTEIFRESATKESTASRVTLKKSPNEEKSVSEASEISSATEISRDSDTDEKSNATLLREAVSFKNALMTRLELNKEETTRTLARSNEDESEGIWGMGKSNLKAKLLDIISEEQSAGSSTEKTTGASVAKRRQTEMDEPTGDGEIFNPESSKALALASESSEYFSLSNTEEVTRRDGREEDSDCENNESKEEDDDNLEKNLSDLVNQSVKNIREYIEVFSQSQNDAIVEAKRAIIEENSIGSERTRGDDQDYRDVSRKTPSTDSITRFVNAVAVTISEELPRKLSEPAIIRLVDLEVENICADKPRVSDYQPDFQLKRRPGSISLAEQSLNSNEDTLVSSHSVNSNDEDGPTRLSPEPSRNELSRGYSSESLSDLIDVESSDTANLVIFEDQVTPGRDYDDIPPPVTDSPLTGRTVVRAVSSSTGNIEISPNESLESNVNNDDDDDDDDDDEDDDYGDCSVYDDYDDDDYEGRRDFTKRSERRYDRKMSDIDKLADIGGTSKISEASVMPETSSVYLTDQASFLEIQTKSTGIGVNRVTEVESCTWILEDFDNSTEKLELTGVNFCGKPRVKVKNEEDEEDKDKDKDKEDEAEEVVRRGSKDLIGEPEVKNESTRDKEQVKSRNETIADNSKVRLSSNNCQEKPKVGPKSESVGDEIPEARPTELASKDLNDPMDNLMENNANRPNSGDTVVINSPRTRSMIHEISNKPELSNDSSGTYMDAISREFLNLTDTSSKLEKSLVSSSSSKSARGSCSSPLRQHFTWSPPRRGSSLNNATTERSNKPDQKNTAKNRHESRDTFKITKNKNQLKGKNVNLSGAQLGARSNFGLNGAGNFESLNIGRRCVSGNVEIRDKTSRSYATPRKSETATTSLKNYESNDNPRPGKARKEDDFAKSDKTPLTIETGNSRCCSSCQNSPINTVKSESKDTPRVGKSGRERNLFKLEKSTLGIEAESSRSCLSKNSPIKVTNSESNGVSRRPGRWREHENSERPSVNVVKSERSTSVLVKNASRSCIPVLRSRLEAVRHGSRDKRAKSPARCPLTISSSSWNQENTSIPIFLPPEHVEGEASPAERVRSITIDSKYDSTIEKINQRSLDNTDKLPESRTVIYVNIVTGQEHKSATRVVDPKKFLEYLKDRDLKIQSVQDQEISGEKMETGVPSSPRILTIVSSAVDENNSQQGVPQPGIGNSTSGSWSLRVEQREIQVSAKPSVMDTSTSISDLPDDTSSTVGPTGGDGKFQIFQIPKELTKDEYIVLLEALNQDPNLHQLREMHKLCNKLGLGFHE